ncbi:dihydropteroate synthase [bacterium]|nr:dihydropteroate synthase [bacterium]
MSAGISKIAFVTGKLAAPALHAVLAPLAKAGQFEPIVLVQKISVAALMTVDWLRSRLELPADVSRLILPGNVRGDLTRLEADFPHVLVERGPLDLLDLPAHLGGASRERPALDRYDIEILSEINHANRLSSEEVFELARHLRRDGADMIDLGSTPSEDWPALESTVATLTADGMRVSIDSFDSDQVARAVRAGASLILSVHSSNWRQAVDLGVEVVVIPDDPHSPNWLEQILRTSDRLAEAGCRHRLDPVLEPIGFGFGRSLGRYHQLREARPGVPMLMGVGNLTELTEVDSVGINAMLIAICQELRIESVLTTQVINYARSSTKEIDLLRRIMAWSIEHQRLPKHLGGALAMLRDPRVVSMGHPLLEKMQQEVRDPNFRIFVEGEEIVAFNSNLFEKGTDPFLLFEKLGVEEPSHAFYLGWEMMKASLAIQLGKQYVQDRSLRWGYLTREEISHRDRTSDARPPIPE